jgi:hypothetical protein
MTPIEPYLFHIVLQLQIMCDILLDALLVSGCTFVLSHPASFPPYVTCKFGVIFWRVLLNEKTV